MIKPLPQEFNWRLCSVCLTCWHVQIIYKHNLQKKTDENSVVESKNMCFQDHVLYMIRCRRTETFILPRSPTKFPVLTSYDKSYTTPILKINDLIFSKKLELDCKTSYNFLVLFDPFLYIKILMAKFSIFHCFFNGLNIFKKSKDFHREIDQSWSEKP